MNSFSHDGCEGWGRGTMASYNSSSKGVKTLASCVFTKKHHVMYTGYVCTLVYILDRFFSHVNSLAIGMAMLFDGWSALQFGPDGNITTIGWMQCCLYIHGPKRMNPNNYDDPLPFFSSAAKRFTFVVSQQQFDGLTRTVVQTFMFPTGWIVINLVTLVKKQILQK